MKAEEIKTLKLEFEGEDVMHFKTAIKKLHEDNSKAGFKATVLTAEELTILKETSEKVNK